MGDLAHSGFVSGQNDVDLVILVLCIAIVVMVAHFAKLCQAHYPNCCTVQVVVYSGFG